MRKRGEVKYKAKVTDDNGLTRSRVPCPLLSAMNAQPGDYIIFRLNDSGKVIMRLSRAGRKSGTGKSRKSKGNKRR